jgi:purine nucleosidase
MKRLIIDTDPGVDDAHALMMAFAHPGAIVEAVTTVGGNVSLAQTTANACTILDRLGVHTPIYAGCDGPLVNSGAQSATHVHGRDGLGEAGYPPSKRRPEAEHAAVALARLANEAVGKLSLAAIGPLTNLAVALKLDPGLPRKFKELLVMGGAVNAQGNTPNVTAEFNIYSDPEAAKAVFEAWPEITLVSWEATLAHPIPAERVAGWLEMDGARARFFQRITAQLLDYNRRSYGAPLLHGPDALALAVMLEPDIVQRAERRHVAVELHGRLTRGQTVVDWTERGGRPANATIVQEVDRARFAQLLENGLK